MVLSSQKWKPSGDEKTNDSNQTCGILPHFSFMRKERCTLKPLTKLEECSFTTNTKRESLVGTCVLALIRTHLALFFFFSHPPRKKDTVVVNPTLYFVEFAIPYGPLLCGLSGFMHQEIIFIINQILASFHQQNKEALFCRLIFCPNSTTWYHPP